MTVMEKIFKDSAFDSSTGNPADAGGVVTLHCTEGGSDKIYELSIRHQPSMSGDWNVTARYGRRSSRSRQDADHGAFSSLPMAIRALEKVTNQKLKKGYQLLRMESIHGKMLKPYEYKEGMPMPANASEKPAHQSPPAVIPDKVQCDVISLVEVPSGSEDLSNPDKPFCAYEEVAGIGVSISMETGVSPQIDYKKIHTTDTDEDFLAAVSKARSKNGEFVAMQKILGECKVTGTITPDGGLVVDDLTRVGGVNISGFSYGVRIDMAREAEGGRGLFGVVNPVSWAEAYTLYDELLVDGNSTGLIYRLLEAKAGDRVDYRYSFRDRVPVVVFAIENRTIHLSVFSDTGTGYSVGTCDLPVGSEMPEIGDVIEVERSRRSKYELEDVLYVGLLPDVSWDECRWDRAMPVGILPQKEVA